MGGDVSDSGLIQCFAVGYRHPYGAVQTRVQSDRSVKVLTDLEIFINIGNQNHEEILSAGFGIALNIMADRYFAMA
jgi:hypothetical protein